MKKQAVFNLIWWFSSPFFIIFFFILFLLHFQGIDFLRASMFLISVLVIAPLLVDWTFTNIFKIKKKDKAIIDFSFIVAGFIYSYFLFFKYMSSSLQVVIIVFVLSMIISYIIYFLKLNQYSFLLGVFLSITLLFGITQMQDLVYIVIFELIFSAFLFRYFIIYEIDDFKGIFINYSAGIITPALLFFIATLFI